MAGQLSLEVEGDYTDYKGLILGDLEISFSLGKTVEVEDFLQLGPTVPRTEELVLWAIKKPMDDRLKDQPIKQV